MLERIEKRRRELISQLHSDTKEANGQFMTPAVIARFMADMFDPPCLDDIRLLDPGAGSGALVFAFLEMLIQRGRIPTSVEVVAYEIDNLLAERLRANLEMAAEEFRSIDWHLEFALREEDFISSAANLINPNLMQGSADFSPFTHVIMNPPYRKLPASSNHRSLLDSVGFRVSNLYSAFMALSVALLADGGEIVAITPRSFCNGPYFRPFRKYLLGKCSFKRIHIFESRESAFNEDEVLQENIISHLQKKAPQERVEVSSSHGRSFAGKSGRSVPYSQIVDSYDPDAIIRIPANTFDDFVLERMSVFSDRLHTLGLEVSTGPVVDFRVSDFIRDSLTPGCVPLIYPSHIQDQVVHWPLHNARKPNAIHVNDSTRRWLLPNECFALVKRFSSKEETRRLYAACYLPVKDFEMVGFENHLNVIHSGQSGIDPILAKGLVSYLSSTIIDKFFRQFSGHTQVNASDLRSIPIPPIGIIRELADFHDGVSVDSQAVDDYLESMFRSNFEISSPNPVLLASR
jgi:adenine-specific DNA-methyltransferase